MDHRKKQVINKIMEDCKDLNEIEYIINRYCGPNNEILCRKVYGVQLYPKDLYEALAERVLLLND